MMAIFTIMYINYIGSLKSTALPSSLTYKVAHAFAWQCVLLFSFKRGLYCLKCRSHDALAPAISCIPLSEQITTSTPRPLFAPILTKHRRDVPSQATEPCCLCF